MVKGRGGKHTRVDGNGVLWPAVAFAIAALATTPATAQTKAGTAIANTATLTYVAKAGAQSLPSNTVTLNTSELLNVTIVADHPTIATRGDATVAVGFVVTNTGNGHEDFALAVSAGSAAVPLDQLAVDSNGDGVYSATVDQSLAVGTALSLAPGVATRVFVLVDTAKVGSAAVITANVTSRTGSGPPNTVLPGAGDGGSDAIIGSTGATASATTQLVAGAGLPSLTKTQSVLAPDGSPRAIAGAIVTYRLVATFVNATRGVVIDDPVPPGTSYVAGSLRLDDATLSDTSDTDPGTATATAIRVALGDVPAAGVRSIQFSVKIQ